MIQPAASSRRQLPSGRQLLLPSITCVLLVGAATSASFGVTLFSSTPTVVFTAAAGGYNTVAVGIDGTYNVNPSPLILQDKSVIGGYETITGDHQDVYYYALGSAAPSIISFTDTDHPAYMSSPYLAEISSTGIAVGNQGRYDDSQSDYLGGDVFYSVAGGTPIAIPLPSTVLGTGAVYSFTSTQVAAQDYTLSVSPGSTNAFSFNTNPVGTNGAVAGTITRYAGNSTSSPYGPSASLGSDGFYYNPATGVSTAIGLTGGQYSSSPSFYGDPSLVADNNIITGMAGTAATGFTELLDPTGNRAGYDGWIYTPSTGTVQIGLTGGAFTYTNPSNGLKYEFTQIFRTNTAGQIVGKSALVSATGDPLSDPAIAWLYTPSSTPGVASGVGTSSAGTYVQLAPSTAPSGTTLGYIRPSTGAPYTNVTFLANNGHAAGNTNRYDTAGNYEGQAAWYYNGTTNVDISPLTSDGIHSAAAGGSVYSTNSISALNNSGMAAAYATRVSGTASGSTSLGQDAYIWDSKTSTRYFVDPTHASLGTTNYEYSYVGVLGDNGLAVGFYNTYAGTASTILTSNLFDWSEATGLQLLATYTGTAYSTSVMQQFVSSFVFASDGNLYGPASPLTNSATALIKYSSARLLGDANLDGKVDLSDLNIVLNHLGAADLLLADGNFDGQPTIDLTDLNDVLNNLGTSSPSAAGTLTATPEPTSLSLLAAGTLLLTRRRKPKQI
jgi:hypothetical protein